MLSSVFRVAGLQQSESIVILLVQVGETSVHKVSSDEFVVWIFGSWHEQVLLVVVFSHSDEWFSVVDCPSVEDFVNDEWLGEWELG